MCATSSCIIGAMALMSVCKWQYVSLSCSELQWVAVSCSELQWVAVSCSELQWVAVKICSELQWVAVSCQKLQWVAEESCRDFHKSVEVPRHLRVTYNSNAKHERAGRDIVLSASFFCLERYRGLCFFLWQGLLSCVYAKRSVYEDMGWLRLVGSLKLQVSFAKKPYKRDYILQKRTIILRSLL